MSIIEGGSSLDIETAKLNKKLWLVKVPNHVAATWRKQCEAAMNPSEDLEDDTPQNQLGTVKIDVGTDQNVATKYNMTLAVPDAAGGQPRVFKLSQLSQTTSTQVVAMSYKAQDSTGAADAGAGLRIEGMVDASFNAMPTLTADDKVDQSYAAVNKERSIKASTKTRTVQTYEDTRENNLTRLANSRVAALDFKRRAEELRRSREDNKRVRADVDVLERQLFSLFERQSHWAMSKLVEETRQPAAHLKSVLEKIAVFNKRGPHRDTFQLKKDYTLSSATEPDALPG